MATGQCDLGFLCGELDDPESLIVEQLGTEKLCFVTQGQLTSDIAENLKMHAPFLFPPELSAFGEDYRRLLLEDMAREDPPVTLESLERIKTTLLSGLGCSQVGVAKRSSECITYRIGMSSYLDISKRCSLT